MSNISPGLHFVLVSCITSVKAEILRRLFIGFRARNDHTVQRIRQQFYVMCIRSGENNCQRNPLLIGENRAFCPHFFHGL